MSVLTMAFVVFCIIFIILVVTSAWNPSRSASPEAVLRRELKRRPKLARKLEKVSKAIGKEKEQLWGIRSAEELLDSFPDANSYNNEFCVWGDYHHTISCYERRVRLLRLSSPLFKRASPLLGWMREWMEPDTELRYGKTLLRKFLKKGVSGWTADDAYELACKLQRLEWQTQKEKHLAKARKLQAEIDELCTELGMQPTNHLAGFESFASPPKEEPVKLRLVETPRDKLAGVRARIAELREEEAVIEGGILEEEQTNAPGPHRRAAGVNTDD